MASWRSYLALCSLQIYGSFCVVSQGYETKNGPEESDSRLFQPAHPFPSLHPHITVLFTLLLETCRGQKCYFTPETRAPLSIQVYVSNNVQECI